MANLLWTFGLTRDSAIWFWGRLSAVLALIASGAADVTGTAAWLGIHLTPVQSHWVTAVSVLVLWVAGKYDSSPLPGKDKP